MIDLTKRSYQLELLDEEDIPFEDIRNNMEELNTINTWLGGHAITTNALAEIVAAFPQSKPYHICEIGCGGGDNLKAIERWCSQKKIPVKMTGIDIKPACIDFARKSNPLKNASWLTSDYRDVDFGEDQPDIIFSSLFCHHFNELELQEQLLWMKRQSKLGFFINDLHRHWLAFYSIKWITALFSKSYLVKNDAPLSVARGFTKKEWTQLMTSAGFMHYQLQWKWAFRHLLIYRHD